MQQYQQILFFGEFAQAAFDNADYGQENASQHVTTTVIYQYCRNGEFNQHVLPQMSSGKGRRRSIKIVPEPLLTVTANKTLFLHVTLEVQGSFR